MGNSSNTVDTLDVRLKQLEELLPEIRQSLQFITTKVGSLEVLDERDRNYREWFNRTEKDISRVSEDIRTWSKNFDEFSERLSLRVSEVLASTDESIKSFKNNELHDLKKEFHDTIVQKHEELLSRHNELKAKYEALNTDHSAFKDKITKILWIATGIWIAATFAWGLVGNYLVSRIDDWSTSMNEYKIEKQSKKDQYENIEKVMQDILRNQEAIRQQNLQQSQTEEVKK